MFSIKNIISKKGRYAFLCKDLIQFERCVRQAFDEGIVFSKSWIGKSIKETLIEDYDYIMENFTKHLSDNNVCALMFNNGNEIQFYARDRSSSYGFNWDEWEVINYTSILREERIKEILN